MDTPASTSSSSTSSSSTALVFLIIGTLAFIVSWFLPVIGDGKGYQAYQVTYQIIFNLSERLGNVNSLWEKTVMVIGSLSPHTNYFMAIIILILLLTGKRRMPGLSAFRNIMIVLTVINLVWLYGFPDAFTDLRIGYYLWMISFLLISIAAHLYARKNKV